MPFSLKEFASRNREALNADDRPLMNPLILVAVLTVLILLIILGVLFYNAFLRPNPYGDSVKLPGLSREIPDLTQKETDLILHNIYNTLANNSSTNVKNKEGTIREGSVEANYNKATTVHSGSFIVDFPSERQSFQVSFEYAKDDYGKNFLSGYNVIVSCLTDSTKIIYEDQVCKAVSPIDSTPTPDQKLLVNLPYTGATPSGKTFYILPRHYFNGNRYYEVSINSCGDQAILDEALASAKSWISSLDLDPSEFTFEVPATYCPGGAHH